MWRIDKNKISNFKIWRIRHLRPCRLIDYAIIITRAPEIDADLLLIPDLPICFYDWYAGSYEPEDDINEQR